MGLGFCFTGEQYYIPEEIKTGLHGDVDITPKAGSIWPMKNWAYFDDLKSELKKIGCRVNFLPRRNSLLEHIGDIQNHRLLISGDSLPMHLALGSGIPCITLFICTSPWEIYDYGLQRKIISPHLERYFYMRNFQYSATTSISREEVAREVKSAICDHRILRHNRGRRCD
jgi:hypothetical protein